MPLAQLVVGVTPTFVVTVYVVVQLMPDTTLEVAPLMKPTYPGVIVGTASA